MCIRDSVVGAAAAGVLVFTPPMMRAWRTAWQVIGIAAIVVMLGVVMMWRTGQIEAYVAPLGIA